MIRIRMGYHEPVQTGDPPAFQIREELILSGIFLIAAAAVHEKSAALRHFQHDPVSLSHIQTGDPKTAPVLPGQYQDPRRKDHE